MILPSDFKAAYQLLKTSRWFERPMLLLVFAGQVIAFVAWVTQSKLWVDRGLLIFLAGFVLLMTNFFIRKPGDSGDFHFRMISAVFLTIIFSTVIGAFIALISLVYGLAAGFSEGMLPSGARMVGVFGLIGFVQTLIREWSFMKPREKAS